MAAMYDNKWYIGNIVRKSAEHQDLYINFMNTTNNQLFYWPPSSKSDECWVPFTDILCIVTAPETQGSSARFYTLLKEDIENIANTFKSYKEGI